MGETYTVLVAEDEPALLRHVCQKIALCGSGYHLLRAENGKQALALAGEAQPDIVISDIRMPELDGLAFLDALKASGCACEAIIMSGYDDFSYAKEAMRLGVCEYLLKPISAPALEKALLEATENVQKARRLRRAELMLEISAPETEMDESEATYSVFLLCYGNRSTAAEQLPREAFMDWDVAGLLQMPEDAVWLLLERSSNECILILHNAPLAPGAVAEKLMQDQWGRGNLHVTMLPEPLPRGALRHAAEQLRRLEEERLTPWSSTIISPDPDWHEVGSAMLTGKEKEQILSCFLTRKVDRLHQLLHSIFDSRWKQGLTQRRFERLVLRTLDACYAASDRKASPQDRASAIQECITQVGCSDSLEEFTDAVFERIGPLLFPDDTQAGNRSRAALRAQNHLQLHYMEQVNLSTLAQQAGMDQASFTRAFRNVCGDTPMKYLIGLRMQAARTLLTEHPEYSVRAVGEMVGYPDPFHFSKTFKKLVGLSPSEFRTANGVME